MRITNTFLSNLPVTQPESRAADASAPADGTAPEKADTSSHAPSAELLALVEQVRNTPDVRLDRLREVAQRLASGYYQSAEAAEKTAQAIQESDL